MGYQSSRFSPNQSSPIANWAYRRERSGADLARPCRDADLDLGRSSLGSSPPQMTTRLPCLFSQRAPNSPRVTGRHCSVNLRKPGCGQRLDVGSGMLSALIDKGLIERVRRGRYIISSGSTEHPDEPSRLKNEPSGLTPEAKFTVPGVTNTTNTLSRTTSSKPY
jgi:hypothetical protein